MATDTAGPARVVGRSVAVGLACYALTYLTVGGLFALDFTAHVYGGGPGGGPVRGLKRLGWVVYNAHLVRTRAFLALNFIELSAGELLVPRAVYYGLPPVVLTAGGWAASRHAPPGHWRVLAGAGVVGGYLPAAAVGALATTTPKGGPEFVPAVLIAGIVYPVAFGTVGGLLADR